MYAVRSKAWVDFGRGANTAKYELSGQLEISVVARRGGEAELFLQLQKAEIRNPGADKDVNLDRLAGELITSGALVGLRDGALARFGMGRSASNGAVATYRDIASGLQATRAPNGRTWLQEEWDGTGRYVAQYDLDDLDGSLSKRKLRYLALLSQPAPLDAENTLLPKVVRSTGRIRWSTDRVLEAVSIEDQLAISAPQFLTESSTHLEIDLKGREAPRSAGEIAALVAGIPLGPASAPLTSNNSPELLDGARTRGKSFRQILAAIDEERSRHLRARKAPAGKTGKGIKDVPAAEAEAAVDATLFGSLVAILRSEPGAVDKALETIKAGGNNRTVLIDALSSASSAGSESALIALLGQGAGNKGLTADALYGLARMQRPGPKSIAILKSVLESDPYNATALYGLGSYSRKFRDAGEAELAAALGEYLVAKLSAAGDRSEKITALRALQNSGYGKSVRAIRPFLNDRDDLIRAAAFRALGPMLVEGVDEILALRMKSSTSSDTQLLMLDVARGRTPTKVLLDAVTNACSVADPNVRYRAVELLGNWFRNDPSLQIGHRAVLEKARDTDPEPRIRALARRAL